MTQNILTETTVIKQHQLQIHFDKYDCLTVFTLNALKDYYNWHLYELFPPKLIHCGALVDQQLLEVWGCGPVYRLLAYHARVWH